MYPVSENGSLPYYPQLGYNSFRGEISELPTIRPECRFESACGRLDAQC